MHITLAAALLPVLLATSAPFNAPSFPTYTETAATDILFKHVGDTFYSLGFAHVRVEFEVSKLLIDAKRYHTAKSRYYYALDSTKYPMTKEVIALRLDAAAQLVEHIEEIPKLFSRTPRATRYHTIHHPAVTPNHPAHLHARARRGVLLAGGIGALVGSAATTLFHVFSNKALNNIRHDADALTARQLRLLRRTRGFSTRQQHLTTIVDRVVNLVNDDRTFRDLLHYDSIMMDALRAEAERVHAVLSAAIQGHAHTEVLRGINITALANSLEDRMARQGRALLSTYHADWLRHDCAFAAHDNGIDFDVILSVPTYIPKTDLLIMHYTKMPIKLADGLFIEIDNYLPYLVVNEAARTFDGWTDADLAQCRRVGNYFTCPTHNVVRRFPPAFDHPDSEYDAHLQIHDKQPPADPATCLLALYLGRYAHARRVCRITIVPDLPMVTQIAPRSFAAFSPYPHQGNLRCANSPAASPRHVSLRNTTTINLPAHCHVMTDTHSFYTSDASFDYAINTWAHVYNWPDHMAHKLLGGLDQSAFGKLRKEAHNLRLTTDRISLHEAIEAVHDSEAASRRQLHHAAAISSTTATLLLLLAAAVATCGCLFCRRRRRRRTGGHQPGADAQTPGSDDPPPPPSKGETQPAAADYPFTRP